MVSGVPSTLPTPDTLERRRVAVFCLVAFGLAWSVAVAIYLTGGLRDSPVLVETPRITLAIALLSTGYMWAPAVANALTRFVTDEGWTDLGLRPRRREWPLWIAAWIGPALLILVGVGVYALLFPARVDPTFGTLRAALGLPEGTPLPLSPPVLVALVLVQAVVISPLINSLFTFGEEFGWRGYLLPKLLPLGWRRAVVVSGVVWGVWHWPVIAMGYNYGVGYPGAPWTGLLAMTWFTVVVGAFLAWVTVRAGSVWPAVVGHAAVNGIGSIGLLFVSGNPTPLLGPAAVGVVVTLGWAIVAAAVLWRDEQPKRR
ncbi:CPBP family intramembrane metalloprotease [Haloplanus aerogenes]|uniref:CAAX prenyl protease-like protein n=1 Tax=Haloplanus aerogenes TaxID=660522 RepID=A0A3M0CX64_9EURY|nr:CPBP family intramembrane metalloprotease [Haloplanus aerogenes]RMB13395.1 CAAX prenyl protease-like protein [Haloplanus aerogenes]